MRLSPVFRFVGGTEEMQLHYLSKGSGKVNLGKRRKPLKANAYLARMRWIQLRPAEDTP